ncbi:hypothetical protein DBV15_04675 [Temnothorax longispinosus]|uniref:Uncharacterized protein n=1 Tax=Temnothorax longispinosus TaxID=300112 RepID=A0A4S2JRU7_9HYME|nr:hypothetical protein DBV15_04675 [Temnothorax longispinosus]
MRDISDSRKRRSLCAQPATADVISPIGTSGREGPCPVSVLDISVKVHGKRSGRSKLMPDTEVSRRRGWTSGWLLARQPGLVHLAGRTAQDIGDHEPRPLRHRRRGIASFQAVVIVQIVVPRVQSVGETFHCYAVPIDDVLQPMRLQARHPAQIQTVIGHGDATESGHVVVLLMMDRHHGRRRWFLRATGTCRLSWHVLLSLLCDYVVGVYEDISTPFTLAFQITIVSDERLRAITSIKVRLVQQPSHDWSYLDHVRFESLCLAGLSWSPVTRARIDHFHGKTFVNDYRLEIGPNQILTNVCRLNIRHGENSSIGSAFRFADQTIANAPLLVPGRPYRDSDTPPVLPTTVTFVPIPFVAVKHPANPDRSNLGASAMCHGYAQSGRGEGGAQAPRAEDDGGGRHGSSGRVLHGERGGWERSRVERAVIQASHFQLALLEMEQRSGSSRERREREKERVQRDLAGRGEVPSKRRRVVPSSVNLLREFTNSRGRAGERTSERANSGVWMSERGVFCYVNFFCVPLSSMLKKRLVKHIKEAR